MIDLTKGNKSIEDITLGETLLFQKNRIEKVAIILPYIKGIITERAVKVQINHLNIPTESIRKSKYQIEKVLYGGINHPLETLTKDSVGEIFSVKDIGYEGGVL